MRPAQQHRVLKEAIQNHDIAHNIQNQRPIINPQQLTPLVQHMNVGGNLGQPNNKLLPFHAHGKLGVHPSHGHQLPRIESSSDREQINNLQQRVKELEKENFKLQHHVQQAEQSIRNYRDILQAHNITNLTPPVIAKETKITSKSHSSIPAPELPVLTKPNIDIDALKVQHQQELKILRDQSDKTKRDLEQTLLNLRNEKDSQAKSISQLQDKLQQIEETYRREKEQLEKRINEQDQQLRNKLSEQEQLHTLQQQLQEQLKQALLTQQTKTKSPSPKKRPQKVAVDDLSPQIQKIFNMVDQIKKQSCNFKASTEQDFVSLQHFCHQSVQLVMRRCKELLQHKELEMERLKIDHDTTIISYMEQIEDLSSQLISAQAIRMQQQTLSVRQDIGCSPMKQLVDSPSKQLLRISAEDHEISKTEIVRLRKQLEDANASVICLQEVHGAEIKAVKHVAHIKELQRVAREREQSLDKDRLQIELKHLKEILNVLTFSLNTAEQSLVELQPQVVTKLIEGRNRRIQMLEQSFKGRLKDVEQRSAETCAVNSQHLEQFQKKATDNEKTAQEMTKSAAAELIRLLQVSI